MKYSLISVNILMGDEIIEGSWVQNHVGTLETATERAIGIEGVNGNKLDIAVVEEVAGQQCLVHFVTRLDKTRREQLPMPSTTAKYPTGPKTTPHKHYAEMV